MSKSEVSERISRIVDDLQETRGQVETRLEEVESERSRLMEERRQLTTALNQLAPAPKPPKKQQRTQHATTNGSGEMARKVEESIRRLNKEGHQVLPDVPGSFTLKDLEQQVGAANSTVKRYVELLRKDGKVRKAGSHRYPQAPRASDVFVYEGGTK